MFKTHIAFGFLVALFVMLIIPVPNKLTFLIIAVIVSSFPDIDTNKSKIGRKTPLLSTIIGTVFGHRKFIHSIFPPLIVFLVLNYFGHFYLGLAIFTGYLSHLLGDALTYEGIDFLYPFSLRMKGFMRSGGFLESIIFVVIILLDFIVLFKFF